MPFGDGMGPLGLGPMTGRGAGFCAGFARPGFANPMPGYPYRYGYAGLAPVWPRWGRGFSRGLGRGFGRGWRRRGAYGYPYKGYGYGYPGGAMPREEEIAMLEEQKRWLTSELDGVRKRLEEVRK